MATNITNTTLTSQDPANNTWVNGVTGQTQVGFPPSNWIVGVDGFYYPPTTAQSLSISTAGIISNPLANTVSNTPTSNVSNLIAKIPTTPVIPFVPPPTGFAPPIANLVNITSEIIFPVTINVAPAVPVFPPFTVSVPIPLTIHPIKLNLNDAYISGSVSLDAGKVNQYFDQERVLKTMLNFGRDYQVLLTNWEFDPRDSTSLLVKLYEPLPDPVDEKTTLWISRELSPSVVDRLFLKFTPTPPPKVYLRPRNKNVAVVGRTGQAVTNATQVTLFSSGAFNAIAPVDAVMQQWFTTDANSADLNISYNNFTKFSFFGSVQARINAFVQKLSNIEQLTAIINMNSASLARTGSANITGSSTYISLQNLGNQRMDIYRTFDGFERFLYYNSGSSYSSSFDNQYQDQFFYTADITYPKSGSGVMPITSSAAQTWYTNISTIATAYDTQNPDALANNIPRYIVDGGKSTEFTQFLNMVGHQFDILKTYIDALPEMYSRDSDPSVAMAPETVWNIAKSFGIDLPNQYAINNIVDYTIGTGASAKVYNQAAAETWKRFLHNQMFMLKTKGTRNSLRALSNTFGLLPTTLQIRESNTPGTAFPTGSYEQYDEQTNVVTVLSGSYFQIPWATSSLSASTFEVRFATTNKATTTVLAQGENYWAMTLQPLTGSYGRIVVQNTANSAGVSSSYFQLYSGNFYSAMVTFATNGVSLTVKRTDNGEKFVDSFSGIETNISGNVSNRWFTPQYVSLGGSGSYFGTGFSGYIDEARTWGEVLSQSVFDIHVRYPGMYNGNTTMSPATTLYTRLSFNKAQDLFNTASYPNESPYARTSGISATLLNIPAINFPLISSFPYNMAVIVRNVIRYSPNAGGSQYSSNKVVVSKPPVLQYISGSSVPVLTMNKSIVSLNAKKDFGVNTNTIGYFFSITDAINDSIIRSLGLVDLQSLIGDPADQYSNTYASLNILNSLYWNNYAYVYDTNKFITFVKNLLEPLFQQARTLIPARSKLLSGIVHEPHILERAKVQVYPLDITAGTKTRRDQKTTHNLQASVVKMQPTASAGFPTKYTSLSLTQSLSVNASMPMYNARYATTSSWNFNIKPIYLDDSTNLRGYQQNLLQVYGASSYTQLTPAQLSVYNALLAQYASPATVATNAVFTSAKTAMSSSGDAFLIKMIEPYTDFTKYGATVFFTDINGWVRIPITTFTRTNQNILTNRGQWAYGTKYSRNDFVYQTGQSGSTVTGDNKEFVCISTNNAFASTVVPGLDPANWRSMTYDPSTTLTLRQAILISSSVSFAQTGSGKPIVFGYRPEHYHKTNDKRLRVRNGYYLGCLQTSGSTTDGQQPVTVTFSAGDTLVVRGASAPVQPTNNSSGPLLNVI
jgi:hypothetical protein